jgi:hypothetical protein
MSRSKENQERHRRNRVTIFDAENFRFNEFEGTKDFVLYTQIIAGILLLLGLFRCEEHLYKRLRPSVGPSVGLSPTMRLRGKLVTSRLLREEEEEEQTDYVGIPLRRDSFAPRIR